MVKFRQVMLEEWEQLPVPQARKAPDAWDEVLNALENGEIVELETTSEKDLRGKRIGISRRARARGFTIEYRIKDNLLYAKRGAPITTKAPAKAKAATSATGAKRRGRPRKDAIGATAEATTADAPASAEEV